MSESNRKSTKKGKKMTKPSCWTLFDAATEACQRLLLYGPPGTGKTMTADLAARALGFTVYSVTLTPDTPAAELRGHWIQGPGGHFVWHDGPAIRAWKDPRGLLLINEIDRGSPDVQSLLYAICDDPEVAALFLPSGEDVRPNRNFRVIATTNAVPEDLPEGLRDRFPARIEISDIHPDALQKVAQDIRPMAQRNSKLEDPGQRFSVRSWIAFSQLRDHPNIGIDKAGALIFGAQWKDLKTAMRIASLEA